MHSPFPAVDMMEGIQQRQGFLQLVPNHRNRLRTLVQNQQTRELISTWKTSQKNDPNIYKDFKKGDSTVDEVYVPCICAFYCDQDLVCFLFLAHFRPHPPLPLDSVYVCVNACMCLCV